MFSGYDKGNADTEATDEMEMEKEKPLEVRVGIRQEASLECGLLDAGVLGQVRWRHDGLVAESNLWDSATGRLQLTSAQAHHAGLWQCEDPRTGRKSQPIQLVVLGE